MKISKILGILCLCSAISFLLTGCQKTEYLNYSYVPTPNTPTPASNAQVQAQLTAAAQSANQSLNELSAIQMSVHPHAQLKPPINPAAAGMSQIVSLDWTGPVEDLLNQIAKVTQYKVRVLGVRPQIPVIVSINATNETIADLLRDTMFQVEKQADITIYPTQRIIELRYYQP